jgi:hypothetical protein
MARWAAGVGLGLIASVIFAVALVILGLPQAASGIAGIVVGGLVCGTITRRRGALQWAGAIALVFAAQFLLGLVIVLLGSAPVP